MCERTLICSISGQDGTYPVKLLLDRGYDVWGSSHDAQLTGFANLHFAKNIWPYES